MGRVHCCSFGNLKQRIYGRLLGSDNFRDNLNGLHEGLWEYGSQRDEIGFALDKTGSVDQWVAVCTEENDQCAEAAAHSYRPVHPNMER